MTRRILLQGSNHTLPRTRTAGMKALKDPPLQGLRQSRLSYVAGAMRDWRGLLFFAVLIGGAVFS